MFLGHVRPYLDIKSGDFRTPCQVGRKKKCVSPQNFHPCFRIHASAIYALETRFAVRIPMATFDTRIEEHRGCSNCVANLSTATLHQTQLVEPRASCRRPRTPATFLYFFFYTLSTWNKYIEAWRLSVELRIYVHNRKKKKTNTCLNNKIVFC